MEKIEPYWFTQIPEELKDDAKELYFHNPIFHATVSLVEQNNKYSTLEKLWASIIWLTKEIEKERADKMEKIMKEISHDRISPRR